MRVVFLDFDGVLNTDTEEGFSADGELWSAAWLEPVLVMRLSELCARADASVVISSSWRARARDPHRCPSLSASPSD